MSAAAAAFVAAPALALGSFLNVVVTRVPERRSLLRPPSSCGSCGTRILWRDNVPVLSWVLLRGHCRHCGSGISAVYPLVEVATAALVVACVLAFRVPAEAALAAAFCAVLLALSVMAAQRRIVPNRIVLPAAGIVLVAHTAVEPSLEWLVWSVVAAGALLLAVLAYPEGLGIGDVKLALLLGAALGATVTVAVAIGLLAALLPTVILVARHGAAARKLGVPLVPCLSLGAVVALFAGRSILDAYVGLF